MIKKRYTTVLGLCFLGGLLAMPAAATKKVDYVLVTNTGTGLKEVDISDMRKILSGKKPRWENGARVTLVWSPKGSSSMAWLAKFVGMPQSRYMNDVLGRVFRGKIAKPISVSTSQAALAVVRAKKGAVAVAPRSMIGPKVVALIIVE